MKWMMFLGFGFPVYGIAQSDGLSTDRPDRTESAGTVPSGIYQMEGGFVVRPYRRRSFGLDLPPALVRLGLSEHLELRVEGGGTTTMEMEGRTDWHATTPEVGVKVGLGQGGTTDIITAVLAKVGVPR